MGNRKTVHAVLPVFIAILAMMSSRVRAQSTEWLNPHQTFPIGLTSGELENTSDREACLFAVPVHVPGANWVRITFESVRLPNDNGSGAFLRLTSAIDNAVQLLDSRSLKQWRNRSAYFNGDTVLLELISPPGVGLCRIDIPAALVDVVDAEPRNTCGATDDRVPSNDPRVARLLPIGCTGWLIRDAGFNFLTAGHCASGGGSGLDVAEFNVPLSNANGTLNHPPPSDQYAVDTSSLQAAVGIEIGNDWAYYGTFDNSTTGMTAFEAQGNAFTLATASAPIGTVIRKTGCGTTDATVPREWNQAQKTLAGPLGGIVGNELTYRIDSSGGDSGSPVFEEAGGLAVAIHTNGGCTSSGGTNHGCSTLHPDLLAAIADPQGVCIPLYFEFGFPNGLPQLVSPQGGTELLVDVIGRNGNQPSAINAKLWVDVGTGFQPSQLESIGGSRFRGNFPPSSCGGMLRYYITAATETGGQSAEPAAAPDESYAVLAAESVTNLTSFNFEAAGGWTVQNITVSSGAWERGVPVGDGTRGDPTVDFDGSGQCFLTGNAMGDSDVDGGPTRLWSASFNLTGMTLPMISYARWFTNDSGEDRLAVEISNNFGVSWFPVESVAGSPGWQQRYIRVADYVPPSNITRIRFAIADDPNNSLTEGAIDAVTVFNAVCPPVGSCRKGDVNQDGFVNGRDISAFVEILTSGETPGTPAYCAADINGDSIVSIDDSAILTTCMLVGNCP